MANQSMAQLPILAQAQQGDPQAIATLMNRFLQLEGITAQVHRTEADGLEVVLEAAVVPDQATLVEFVSQGLRNLRSPVIHTVSIQAKTPDHSEPVWTQTLNLAEPPPLPGLPVPASPMPDDPPEAPRSLTPPHLGHGPNKALLWPSLAVLGTLVFSGAIIWSYLAVLTNPNAVNPATSARNTNAETGFQPTGNTTVLDALGAGIRTETNPNSLTLTEYNWVIEPQGRYLVGKVKNQSSQAYAYVQVEFDLYNEVGAPVGETLAGIDNLQPNQERSFRAIVLAENAKDARLKSARALQKIPTDARLP